MSYAMIKRRSLSTEFEEEQNNTKSAKFIHRMDPTGNDSRLNPYSSLEIDITEGATIPDVDDVMSMQMMSAADYDPGEGPTPMELNTLDDAVQADKGGGSVGSGEGVETLPQQTECRHLGNLLTCQCPI